MNLNLKHSIYLLLLFIITHTVSAQTADALVITPEGNVEVVNGNMNVPKGNVNVPKGNVNVMNGNVSVRNGNVSVTDGNVNVINGKVQENGNALLPKGAIILWYGAAPAPDGWAICDGGTYNGVKTPDLRDRFVVGAGKQYRYNDTGGAEKVALTIRELPAHDHRFTTDNRIRAVSSTTSQREKDSGGFATHSIWDTGSDKSTYPIDSYSSIGKTGENEAHENRPPYHALYYIIRVK